MFPKLPKDLPADRFRFWFGHRPSMPDGRPCLGYSRASRDVVYAFGHGHIGLVSPARTGRVVAQLIGGRAGDSGRSVRSETLPLIIRHLPITQPIGSPAAGSGRPPHCR
jgi:glycine/D-amino acid oxidase-like deaminating enzyme